MPNNTDRRIPSGRYAAPAAIRPGDGLGASSRMLVRLADLVRPLDFRRADECARVLDWLDARAGERILDVGCGDGFYDRQIARRGARVDGIDMSAARVARAAAWHPHSNVTYHQMPAGALTFADQSFDKVVSICVLEHIHDDVQALAEMFRVLRPGGRLVLSCDSLSNTGIGERLRRRHAQRYDVQRFYSRRSLDNRLHTAGFVPVRSTFILSTRTSLAFTRFTYIADDAGLVPGGVILKYPALALAGVLGLPISRLSERLKPGAEKGLTLVAEAVRPD